MSQPVQLSNAMLKGIMTDAMVGRAILNKESLDLNTQTKAGAYVVDVLLDGGQIENSPRNVKRGILNVFTSETSVLQVFYKQMYSGSPAKFIAYRINWYSLAWSAWHIVDAT